MTMGSKARTLSAAAMVLLGLSMGLIGCRQDAGSAPPQVIPEVQVVTVSAQAIPDEPEFIAQAEASRPVEIRSQVTGILKHVFYAEGRDVKKGDKLYQIDPVPFQAAAASAKARVAEAQARLVQAGQQLARVKPLIAEQAVSQKDLDDAVAEQLAATASLQGAKAELIRAQFDFQNTIITAPIDGLIERSRFYEGRLVSAQTDLLTVIHRVDPMYVVANVPETFLLKRRRDIEAKRIRHPETYKIRGSVTFMDGTSYPHEGTLDLLEVGLRTETGSRQVRMTFPNPERDLLPGQFLKLRIKGDVKTDAILVPQRAVMQGPKGPFVYVVSSEEKIEPREVMASNWQGDQWLIDEGLKTGERVVVNGLMKVGPGAPVKAVPLEDGASQDAQPTPPAPVQG
ncbi:hemolysin D [Nitrospira sp.]|nr:hemolysin D [Nitrospira sp.]